MRVAHAVLSRMRKRPEVRRIVLLPISWRLCGRVVLAVLLTSAGHLQRLRQERHGWRRGRARPRRADGRVWAAGQGAMREPMRVPVAIVIGWLLAVAKGRGGPVRGSTVAIVEVRRVVSMARRRSHAAGAGRCTAAAATAAASCCA